MALSWPEFGQSRPEFGSADDPNSIPTGIIRIDQAVHLVLLFFLEPYIIPYRRSFSGTLRRVRQSSGTPGRRHADDAAVGTDRSAAISLRVKIMRFRPGSIFRETRAQSSAIKEIAVKKF